MAGVERIGDREVDHRVTEELEAFVVPEGDVGVFVLPARMDERLFEESRGRRTGSPIRSRERLGGTHGPEGSIRCRESG